MQKFTLYASILPCCLCGLVNLARADEALPKTPPEEAPKKVSKIVVVSNPIFDESDPDAFFIHRWANYLHINTKEYVVRDRLTFDENDTVTQKDLDESQRLLRAEPYIRDAKVYVSEKDPESDVHPDDESVVIEIGITGHCSPLPALVARGGTPATPLA